MARAEWLRGPAIGLGSTATVFLAASSAPGDVFAIKSVEFSRSALLQREQSILSALSSPAIISCFGFDVAPRDEGTLFYNLFLEYASGGSLADHIKHRGGRLDDPAVRSKTHDILTGLAYLHGRGVVHCDVKPENVLLVSGGRAKIGDLGCARWLAAGEREIRGTPIYMAPEALRGEEQGKSADVWSLGCTVIEMFSGRQPWPEIVDVVAAIHRVGLSGDVPEIPAWVSAEARDFLDKCLRKDPEDRWTAEELLRHSFAASDCADVSWTSPKSILDFSLWASVEEENEEEEEEEEEEEGEGFCDEDPAKRICELAVVSGGPVWDWNEEWLEVREGNGELTEEAAGAGDEGMVDGRWNGDDTASTLDGEDLMPWSCNEGSNSCKFCDSKEQKSIKKKSWRCKMKSIRFWNGDCYYFGLSNWCYDRTSLDIFLCSFRFFYYFIILFYLFIGGTILLSKWVSLVKPNIY